MESSQVVGDSDQKCSDTESGWTMYIGSQICNENYGEEAAADEEKDNVNKPISLGGGGGGGDESDDSMASDASSVPILQELIPDGIKEGSEMLAKCFPANKKASKQEKKRNERRIKREKKAQLKVVPKPESTAESQV